MNATKFSKVDGQMDDTIEKLMFLYIGWLHVVP